MSLSFTSEPASRLGFMLLAVVFSSACTAEISGTGGPEADQAMGARGVNPGTLPTITDQGGPLPSDRDGVASACKAKAGVLDTGRTPLRRLTRIELDNSIRALLQVEAAAATKVTPDEKMGPFYSNAIAHGPVRQASQRARRHAADWGREVRQRPPRLGRRTAQ